MLYILLFKDKKNKKNIYKNYIALYRARKLTFRHKKKQKKGGKILLKSTRIA
tara:strand:+ start:10900 stop:11055 length:156 start_codon:yes stop_codon:yes gene_type:complete